MKKMFGYYFNLSAYDQLVKKQSAQSGQKCQICKLMLGTTHWYQRGAKYFHHKCSTDYYTFQCGHYFKKEEFKKQLKIEGSPEIRHFIEKRGKAT